ncbi:DUF1541 domain-containing protein [Cohnella massiliensis]|uniref:DUF1541 domain-containing protein n=1 Tax=Cohnella massiliensis TaxID=1816691 RepID=UPI0009B9B748|nr:DUF1541 domain-containing protein [Cohnella massiliensis]
MPGKLRDIRVHEGSLVDSPANPRARVVLFKREASGKSKYNKGDLVEATVNHMPGMKGSVGKIALIADEPVYGIDFGDGKIHKWLAESELKPAPEGAEVKSGMKMTGMSKGGGKGGGNLSLRDRIAALFKRNSDPVSFADALRDSKMDEQWWRLQDALRTSIRSIMDSEAQNKGELIQRSLIQYMGSLMDLLPDLEEKMDEVAMQKTKDTLSDMDSFAEEVAKAGKVISDANMKRLEQAMSAIDEILTAAKVEKKGERGTMPTMEEILKGFPEDQRSAILDALNKQEKEVADLKKRAEEAEAKLKKANNPDPEDVWKGVNPEVRKRFEEMEKRAKEAEDVAKREQEARVKKEFIAKASGYRGLPIQPEEFGLVLKEIAEKSPEQFAKLEEVLKAADEAIATGKLFEEVGKGGGSGGASDTWAKIEKAAEEMMKSDSKLTKEQAITKVAEKHPELVEAYRKGV